VESSSVDLLCVARVWVLEEACFTEIKIDAHRHTHYTNMTEIVIEI
jgi:hypothetical protein